jgi:CYTH domain-containing protein
MPTEHEYKYVIRKDALDNAKRLAKKVEEIEQGYTVFNKGVSARIRVVTKDSGKKKYFFTYKQKVGDRVIELEQKLDERDGQELWATCIGKLKKYRYELEDSVGHKWELDFFYDPLQCLYFAMAEVEVEEGHGRPATPRFIKDYLVYEVPLTDDRFANKRLGDLEYAKNLYETLGKQKE